MERKKKVVFPHQGRPLSAEPNLFGKTPPSGAATFPQNTSSSEGIFPAEKLFSVGSLCTSAGQSLGNTHGKNKNNNNQVDNAKDITVTQVFLSFVPPTVCIQPKGKDGLYEEGELGI